MLSASGDPGVLVQLTGTIPQELFAQWPYMQRLNVVRAHPAIDPAACLLAHMAAALSRLRTLWLGQLRLFLSMPSAVLLCS